MLLEQRREQTTLIELGHEIGLAGIAIVGRHRRRHWCRRNNTCRSRVAHLFLEPLDLSAGFIEHLLRMLGFGLDVLHLGARADQLLLELANFFGVSRVVALASPRGRSDNLTG